MNDKQTKQRGRELTPAQVEQRQRAAVTHGARSERQISSRARAHRRRLLRQMQTNASALDAIALAHLDLWSRCMARLSLYDAWADEHGWLDEETGAPPAFTATYMAAINSARLSLRELESHLKARGSEPSMVVALQGEARRVER